MVSCDFVRYHVGNVGDGSRWVVIEKEFRIKLLLVGEMKLSYTFGFWAVLCFWIGLSHINSKREELPYKKTWVKWRQKEVVIQEYLFHMMIIWKKFRQTIFCLHIKNHDFERTITGLNRPIFPYGSSENEVEALSSCWQ